MNKDNNYTTINEIAFSNWKKKYDFYWMNPISHSQYIDAKNGIPLLTVTPNKKVPQSWYINCKRKKVLGVAAGGGQQMAIFSALGANCTLLDISQEQLEADKFVSKRENYSINLIKGDMSKRLPFEDNSFDIVINPVSNHYILDIDSFFKEIYRVLKKGGIFIAGLENEVFWATNSKTGKIENKLPINPLINKELYDQLVSEGNALQFSHTTVEQLNGQIKAGFILQDMYDDTEEGIFKELNIPTFIATLANKR